MTTDLNFEAEPFGGFPGSHNETFEESEVVVRDHRTGVPVRSGVPRGPASRQVFRSPRAAAVRDHRWRGGAPFVTRRVPGSFRGGPGYVRGFQGRPFDGRRWYGGGRRFPFGATGTWGRGWYSRDWSNLPFGERFRHDFRRRWPWWSRYRTGGWLGPGSGFDTGSDTGSGFAPDTGGAPGSGFDPGMGSVAGFPSAPSPLSAPSPSEDPQIISWAQGCLAHIIGGWVPQDGALGPTTLRAIQLFQNRAQLPSSGTLDDNTLSALHQACEASGAAVATAPPPPGMGTDTSAVVPPSQPPGPMSTPPPPPTPPTPPAQSAPTPELGEMFGEMYEGEAYEMENTPVRRSCEPDRCTSAYIRWMQTSLNQVFGQRLAVTGLMDDPTMGAIDRFRMAKRLRIPSSYHVGPVIESALLAAGAAAPPAVQPTQCAPSDPRKLIPVLDRSRGDIPLEFLLGWIDVESAWVLEPPSVTCERGFFQLYPEDSVLLGFDHDRIGTDAAYSIQSGVPFVNRARQQIDRAVRAFNVPRNGDVYWHLVKLWHWIPSAPEKILASMSAQGQRATDWDSIRKFAASNRTELTKIIRRDPVDGIRGVDGMFKHVEAWRKRLNP